MLWDECSLGRVIAVEKKNGRIQRRSLKCHKAAGLNVQLLQTSLLLAVGGLASCYSAKNLVHKNPKQNNRRGLQANFIFFVCFWMQFLLVLTFNYLNDTFHWCALQQDHCGHKKHISLSIACLSGLWSAKAEEAVSFMASAHVSSPLILVMRNTQTL